MTIDYKALAERLEAHAECHANVEPFDDEQRQWADDLRTVVSLLREMAEAKPLFFVHALGQDDEEIIHAVAMNGECPKCEPLFTHPAPQPQPTEAQIEAAADVVLAWESETFGKASARVFADAVLRAALAAKQPEPTEEYEILCNDKWVAGANGPGARAEILHYLTQYEQDGPCEVYAVTRRLVDRAALAQIELPNVVKTAPERIYLVIGEDCPDDATFSDDEVTWCADKIDDNSIPYVRADRAALTTKESK